MCGIAGFWLFKQSHLRSPEKNLLQMTDRLAHRGPDDSGHCIIDTRSGDSVDLSLYGKSGEFNGDLFLGHRRLSIIDLTRAGHQPMQNGSNRSWITYNGEIYNYIELREELTRLGHIFRTKTDTEVILAAYDHWGFDCLKKFNGMFAFALWDPKRQCLFCARDRFGIKPFYYYHDAHIFAFASEIKALLKIPKVLKEPNDPVIYDYLVSRIVDHSNETFFRKIYQIPPSHYLRLDCSGSIEPLRWWDVELNTEYSTTPGEADSLTTRFRDLLKESVSLRMRSDVPVGTCLSGGLDSSSIVCLVNDFIRSDQGHGQTAIGKLQKTYSACFEDLRFDERKFIQPVVEHTGSANFQVFPDARMFWEELFDFVGQMDEPVLSTSPYSQWNVMRKVKETGVKVVLDGQGSDELLAGYPVYNPVFIATLLKRHMTAEAWKAARAMGTIGGQGKSVKDIVLKTGYGLLPVWLQRTLSAFNLRMIPSPVIANQTRVFLDPSFRNRHDDRLKEWISTRESHFKDLPGRLYDDVFRFYLPSLLRYEDRNSMAHSVEARMPFLDYRLVELIFSMPMTMKINHGWSKWVLRSAMKNILPDVIRCRKDKMGFVTPEANWLKENHGHIRELFSRKSELPAYLKIDKIKNMIDDVLNAENPIGYVKDIWCWINLECWMRIFF